MLTSKLYEDKDLPTMIVLFEELHAKVEKLKESIARTYFYLFNSSN